MRIFDQPGKEAQPTESFFKECVNPETERAEIRKAAKRNFRKCRKAKKDAAYSFILKCN